MVMHAGTGASTACQPPPHHTSSTLTTTTTPSTGALALLAALRSRVATAEADLAARQTVLDCKRGLLERAHGLVGRLCADSLAGDCPSSSASPPLLTSSLTSRLTRAGDWAVSVRVEGEPDDVAAAALVLVPDERGPGPSAASDAWTTAGRAPALASPDGRDATLTSVVRGVARWARTVPVRGTAAPLTATACVVVAKGAAAAVGVVPAGTASLGWDALLAFAARALPPAEEEEEEDEEGGGDGAHPATLDLALLSRSDAASLTAALARVLGPRLAHPVAGRAALAPPATIRLAAPSPGALARLAAGVRAALEAVGLETACPALPPAAPGAPRLRLAALAAAARAMVVEVGAAEAATAASLRAAEGCPEAESEAVRSAWTIAAAAAAATDAAVGACV